MLYNVQRATEPHTACTYGAFEHVFDICHSIYTCFQSARLCTETSICSSNGPSVSLVSCVLEVPVFTSPKTVSSVVFGTFLSHPICRIVAYFSLCPLTSSHFPAVKQSLSILLPDLIMSVVRESVASPESHGRQLHSEVGHMVRWVTRADSNRPRDGQRDQAAVSTAHFINTRRAPELGDISRVCN